MNSIIKLVSDLVHHPRNAEVYTNTESDMSILIESIKNIGLLTPLIINKKNQVISGNRRLEALRELDIKEVLVIIKDLDPDQELYELVAANIARKKTYSEMLNEIAVIRTYYEKKQGKRNDLLTRVEFDKKTTRKKVADTLNMKEGTIQKLELISKHSPTLLPQIDQHKISLDKAYKEVLFNQLSNEERADKQQAAKDKAEAAKRCPWCENVIKDFKKEYNKALVQNTDKATSSEIESDDGDNLY